MAFTVSGSVPYFKGTQTVEYDAGELRGSTELVLTIQDNARLREGDLIGPVEGPYTTTKHLDNELSALFLITSVFFGTPIVTGDVPTRPPIPEGAIG